MGAVQKLATMVIVGLVGLATLLVVYLADEPNRRAAEAHEQEEVAIERGIETFLANCVTCHGPGGEGATSGDGRIGAALGGNTEAGRQAQELNQSEDPTTREERYNYIVTTLQNGRNNIMPAFGRGTPGGAVLNDEQIYELATMIQTVDWDVVYNEATRTEDEEGNVAYVYPTAPAVAPAAGGGADVPAVAGAAASIAAWDIGWESGGQRTAVGSPISVTVPPGALIALPNTGGAAHNFVLESLGGEVIDMPVGETVEYTLAADVAPGTYEFICNLPGHAAAGMVGNLVVDPNAVPAAAEAAPAAEAAAPVASPAP